MFRTNFRLVFVVPVAMLSLVAFAQQNTTSPANASDPNAAQTQQQPASPPTAPANQSDALPDDPGTAAHVAAPLMPDGPTAVIDTSMGRMTCGLYSKEAPQTVANFEGLATGNKEWTNPATHQKVRGKSLYNGTTFHRVIPGFMIQGGDPLGNGTGDPGYYVNDEVTPDLNFDIAGRLAMANSGPNTNGSQFFITVAPQPDLDQHYSIFGQCDPASVLVAQSITEVSRDGQDKPLDPVYIKKITIVQAGQPLPPTPSSPTSSPAATSAPDHP